MKTNVASSIAVLRVGIGEGDSLSYTLRVHGEDRELSGQAPADLVQLREVAARERGPESGDAEGLDAARGTRLEVPSIPGALGRRLRQWIMSGDGGQTLCVSCDDSILWDLPWEALPSALGIERLAVARLAGAGVPRPLSPPDRPTAVIAAWPWYRDHVLPGVARELQALDTRFREAYLPVTALSEPTVDRLREVCRNVAPALLHIAHPGAERPDEPGERSSSPVSKRSGPSGAGRSDPRENLRLPVPDDDGRVHWLSAEDLAGILSDWGISLLVLSTCAGGVSMARVLAHCLGAVVVGWPGQVGDAAAADFSLFFYERLLEGSTPVAAVEAFRRSAAHAPAGPAEVPMVWLPSVDAAGWSPLAHPRSTEPIFRSGLEVSDVRGGHDRDRGYRDRGYGDPNLRGDGGFRRDAGGSSDSTLCGEARVRLDFEPLAAINPALLLNGRPAIERLSVTSGEPIGGVQLRIDCDTGAGASIYRSTLDLQKGVQPIAVDQARFPVLYDLIRKRAERRYVNFMVRLTAGGVRLAETTRSVLWMGPNEWMDARETWPFIPAFVQPNSKGVLEVIRPATEVLHGDAPKNDFSGYQSGEADDVRLQMKALFKTLRGPSFALTYINPPSGAVYVPGSSVPSGQRVRLTDDVVEQKRGTCHDLALLFASCAEHVGIHPLVILIPGHTFAGFWTSGSEHRQFWANRAAMRGDQFGKGWILYRPEDMERLVAARVVEVFEATKVTRAATYEEARAEGERRIGALRRTGLDAAVDVSAARVAVQAM